MSAARSPSGSDVFIPLLDIDFDYDSQHEDEEDKRPKSFNDSKMVTFQIDDHDDSSNSINAIKLVRGSMSAIQRHVRRSLHNVDAFVPERHKRLSKDLANQMEGLVDTLTHQEDGITKTYEEAVAKCRHNSCFHMSVNDLNETRRRSSVVAKQSRDRFLEVDEVDAAPSAHPKSVGPTL